MIEPRLYESSDAAALDALLHDNIGHDVSLEHDRIVYMGEAGMSMGLLVWRPIAFVHELFTCHGLGQRSVADRLVQFAIGDVKHRRFEIHEALFLTDSDRMADYAIERGAVEQFGKRTFTMRIK